MKNFEDVMENVKKALLRSQERSPFIDVIERGTGFNRFAALREFYANANFEILSAREFEWGIDPYEIDWLKVFTPIEFSLWQDIRQEGLVMYPQYPVAGYFLDFANPMAKVAIECDGAAYHLDKAKDAARDAKLRSIGWSVYRITGRDCKTDFDSETNAPGVARKLIRQIASQHRVSSKWA
jgi:very-short-patch-repair endonuclease